MIKAGIGQPVAYDYTDPAIGACMLHANKVLHVEPSRGGSLSTCIRFVKGESEIALCV
jgi:hypothetical protein